MLAGLMVTCVFLGYEIGRLRPVKLLIDWNWRRAMWGGKDTTTADAVLFMVLHPVKAARAYEGSPWYQAPPKPVTVTWNHGRAEVSSD